MQSLISGILRHGMPFPFAVEVIANLNVDSESINTWKVGVERALKKFIPDGTKAADKICSNAAIQKVLFTRKAVLNAEAAVMLNADNIDLIIAHYSTPKYTNVKPAEQLCSAGFVLQMLKVSSAKEIGTGFLFECKQSLSTASS